MEQDELIRQLRQPQSASPVSPVPGIQSPEAAAQTDAPATPERRAGTSSLMETTSLMGDPNQMKKSPKAAFLSNADKYGYGEQKQLLSDLQANPDYGHFFKGWEVGGHGDLLQFNGDPSQLAPEWGGVTSFDTIGDFDPATGQARGWRWGVGEGRGGGGAAQGAAVPRGGGMPGGMSSVQGIESLMPTDTNFFNTLQARLAEILGGPQALERDALLNQLRG